MNQIVESAVASAVPSAGGSSGGASRLTHDVQKVMNIHHFEELKRLFEEEKSEETGGFPIDKFREVFGRVFHGMLSYDDITTLFMKIDANSDGNVSWDEFSTYMMMGTINSEEKMAILDELGQPFLGLENEPLRQNTVKVVQYFTKEKKYVSVSIDGSISVWSHEKQLIKTYSGRDIIGGKPWVTSACCMLDQGKVVIACDDSRIHIFDLFSISPRLLLTIGPMEHVPTAIDYHGKYDEQKNLVIWGDQAGNVHMLMFVAKSFLYRITDDKTVQLVSRIDLVRRSQSEPDGVSYKKRQVHLEAVTSIGYSTEFSSFISTSTDSQKSLSISTISRKQERSLRLSKGVTCYEVSRSPTFLITTGHDKIIRLWNPYVLQKPAGALTGHNARITHLRLNHDTGYLISMDEQRVILIWSIRSLTLVQTIQDLVNYRLDQPAASLLYNPESKCLIIGQESLVCYESYRKKQSTGIRSHDTPLVGALYNHSFHQIVSACKESVKVWNLATGEKLFQFRDLHDSLEITCMAFDKTQRRLITGSRNGQVRMWNFNNGQMLQSMRTTSQKDLTSVAYIQTTADKFIVCVGWDHSISLFSDNPGNMNCEPDREFNGTFMGRFDGHKNDILTLDYAAQKGLLATGSVDGEIILWNFSSGHVKGKLIVQDVEFKPATDRGVESVLFLEPAEDEDSIQEKYWPLVSCHGDGYLRFWDCEHRTLIKEIACKSQEKSGLTSLAYNKIGKELLVGDTDGNIRLFELSGLNANLRCTERKFWKAHLVRITSVEFVAVPPSILTSASDGTVRVWTPDGSHVGILGQEKPWLISNAMTYAPYPEDLSNTADDSPEAEKRREDVKLSVVRELGGNNMLGVTKLLVDKMEQELVLKLCTENIPSRLLRERVMEKAVAVKWQAAVEKRKRESGTNVTIDPAALETFRYFTLKPLEKSKKRVTFPNFRQDLTFHNLPTYDIQHIELPIRDDPSAQKLKNALPEEKTLTNRKFASLGINMQKTQGSYRNSGRLGFKKSNF
eukprot:Partr_v1_DN27487_c0_g1_i5_m71542 putative WD repeat-containing protein on Y